MIEIIIDDEKILSNENWRNANQYKLCTKDEYFASAYFICLKKQVNCNSKEALIYILLRHVAEEESWTDAMIANANAGNFMEFVLHNGYLSNTKGFRIPIRKFWKVFQEIINGISEEQSFVLTNNGMVTDNQTLLNENEIITVFCFIDDWNNQQYYIETKDYFHFFSWGTAV